MKKWVTFHFSSRKWQQICTGSIHLILCPSKYKSQPKSSNLYNGRIHVETRNTTFYTSCIHFQCLSMILDFLIWSGHTSNNLRGLLLVWSSHSRHKVHMWPQPTSETQPLFYMVNYLELDCLLTALYCLPLNVVRFHLLREPTPAFTFHWLKTLPCSPLLVAWGHPQLWRTIQSGGYSSVFPQTPWSK